MAGEFRIISEDSNLQTLNLTNLNLWSNSKGNKAVPAKVATTCTEDGHRQTNKAGTAL
jgi:hypothetical protein